MQNKINKMSYNKHKYFQIFWFGGYQMKIIPDSRIVSCVRHLISTFYLYEDQSKLSHIATTRGLQRSFMLHWLYKFVKRIDLWNNCLFNGSTSHLGLMQWHHVIQAPTFNVVLSWQRWHSIDYRGCVLTATFKNQNFSFPPYNIIYLASYSLNRRGRDRMVVRFTTTCAISAYHH